VDKRVARTSRTYEQQPAMSQDDCITAHRNKMLTPQREPE